MLGAQNKVWNPSQVSHDTKPMHTIGARSQTTHQNPNSFIIYHKKHTPYCIVNQNLLNLANLKAVFLPITIEFDPERWNERPELDAPSAGELQLDNSVQGQCPRNAKELKNVVKEMKNNTKEPKNDVKELKNDVKEQKNDVKEQKNDVKIDKMTTKTRRQTRRNWRTTRRYREEVCFCDKMSKWIEI